MKDPVLEFWPGRIKFVITTPDDPLLDVLLGLIRELEQSGLVVEQELNNQAIRDDKCHKVVPTSGPEHERY